MKIYIVKAPQGEYESYQEPIVKMFANKEKAEEYIKIENTKKSLKQQVREAVVEEIKEKFNDTIKHHFCPNPSSVDFITLCISEVEEFLDQVKGESNVKD